MFGGSQENVFKTVARLRNGRYEVRNLDRGKR